MNQWIRASCWRSSSSSWGTRRSRRQIRSWSRCLSRWVCAWSRLGLWVRRIRCTIWVRNWSFSLWLRALWVWVCLLSSHLISRFIRWWESKRMGRLMGRTSLLDSLPSLGSTHRSSIIGLFIIWRILWRIRFIRRIRGRICRSSCHRMRLWRSRFWRSWWGLMGLRREILWRRFWGLISLIISKFELFC